MKLRLLLSSLIGLLLLAVTACGGSSTPTAGVPRGTTPAVSRATTVTVTLRDFTIRSSLTRFSMGSVYHFVVTNSGQATHELMAGPLAAAQSAEAVRDAAKLFEVADVAPGQTKTLDYTFTQLAGAGILEFSCHVTGHYEQHMRLAFTVVA